MHSSPQRNFFMPRRFAALAAILIVSTVASAAVHAAPCPRGAYGPAGDGDFVVVVPLPDPSQSAQRYLFRDGRRGSTGDANAPVRCLTDGVEVRNADGTAVLWPRRELAEADTAFDSHGARMAGRLIEPATNDALPLVVMVHGSERSSATGSAYAYALAAQGLRVFAYDKRGTGASEGDYTQNFELLADDAAAALAHAKTLATGRIGRAGYFGGSQGGWVAPLASTRSAADFVAVGFGLVVSPIDEDREQMIDEARKAGLGADAMAAIDRLSQATARLLTSQFRDGLEALGDVRRELEGQPWADAIQGEHSGQMLRTPDDVLRRVGRPLFDQHELIWNYDSVGALRKVKVPLLWVLAEDDREAPIERTRDALLTLIDDGRPIDLYMFPDTDHGMFEYETLPDGSRRVTRITDGYLRLLADWIRGTPQGSYGRGMQLGDEKPVSR
jgi:pimeloyl-ACP methyl ester carboxylesterase